MIIHFSQELTEAMFGDEAVLKYLEMAREYFHNGDKSALLGAVFLCARYQAVIPEWAANALLRIESDLESGVVEDPNNAFGWVVVRKGSREKESRQNNLIKLVLGKLQSHRLAGGGLNADLDLQQIADDLQITRRDVEDIYKRHGKFIKDLPRGAPPGNIYAQAIMNLPFPRRQGRPILHDAPIDTKVKNSVSD